MLGRLDNRPSKQVYYIEDCRIYGALCRGHKDVPRASDILTKKMQSKPSKTTAAPAHSTLCKKFNKKLDFQ